MKRIFTVLCALAFIVYTAYGAPNSQKQGRPGKIPSEDLSQANNPEIVDVWGPNSRGPVVLRAQILLDRAAFSPGEIDGAYGPNLRAAIRGFQTARQLPVTGELGPETWAM